MGTLASCLHRASRPQCRGDPTEPGGHPECRILRIQGDQGSDSLQPGTREERAASREPREMQSPVSTQQSTDLQSEFVLRNLPTKKSPGLDGGPEDSLQQLRQNS